MITQSTIQYTMTILYSKRYLLKKNKCSILVKAKKHAHTHRANEHIVMTSSTRTAADPRSSTQHMNHNM